MFLVLSLFLSPGGMWHNYLFGFFPFPILRWDILLRIACQYASRLALKVFTIPGHVLFTSVIIYSHVLTTQTPCSNQVIYTLFNAWLMHGFFNGEIKIYFYLAMVGFEPTPTSTAAPSNTETTVIPSRQLRSLKKELSWPRFMLDFSALPIG